LAAVAVSVVEQAGEIARRSVLQTVRQPALVVPPILFPLILMGINVGGLDAATMLPGFPTDSYLNFAIAFPFIQGSLFASINAGSAVARDVETGFLNRLALTPMQRAALLLGNLSGVMAVSLFSSLVYLAVGFAAGLHVVAGVGGVLVLLLLAQLIALAFASIGAFVGLRTGSGEAVQGVFPLFFVFLFLSSSSLPRDLIEQDWFRTIATYNPISYLFEGLRSLIIFGWQAKALALGFGVAAALAVLGVAGSASALRTRLARA
jgi:ABC-2 type transport system permease protein